MVLQPPFRLPAWTVGASVTTPSASQPTGSVMATRTAIQMKTTVHTSVGTWSSPVTITEPASLITGNVTSTPTALTDQMNWGVVTLVSTNVSVFKRYADLCQLVSWVFRSVVCE